VNGATDEAADDATDNAEDWAANYDSVGTDSVATNEGKVSTNAPTDDGTYDGESFAFVHVRFLSKARDMAALRRASGIVIAESAYYGVEDPLLAWQGAFPRSYKRFEQPSL